MKRQSHSSLSMPVTGEPLALELVNTTFIEGGLRGRLVDALTSTEHVDTWVAEHLYQFSVGAQSVFEGKLCTQGGLERLLGLRSALRACLGAITEGARPANADVAVINSLGRHGVFRLELASTDPVTVLRRWDIDDPWEILLGEIAFGACELLLPDRIERIRACPAPGCILFFEKAHPRREWCSATCGNRARVARHADKAATALQLSD